MRHRINTIAIAAITAALAVAGLAYAHGDRGDRHSGVWPSALAGGKSFTYSETHLRRNGEDVAFRADQGKVVSASDTGISIARNDGETVDVPVDGNTRLLGGWWRGHDAKASHHGDDDDEGDDPSVADIPVGKRVIVLRTDDDPAAEAVKVARRHGHSHHRSHGGDRRGSDGDHD